MFQYLSSNFSIRTVQPSDNLRTVNRYYGISNNVSSCSVTLPNVPIRTINVLSRHIVLG